MSGCNQSAGGVLSMQVDLLYPDAGILIRGLPGVADLANRSCWPQAFDREAELNDYKTTVARGELPELTVLKARGAEGGSRWRRDTRCGAKLDVALGIDANFVLLDIAGKWKARGPEAHIENAAVRIRGRLERFGWSQPHVCAPSLSYACAEHPSAVQLEVTTHCNLRCGYCNHGRLPAKRHTPIEEIVRILQNVDFNQTTEVDLTGLGEPLLHPGLAKIIGEIRLRGHLGSIALVTNGTLATVDRCRPLLAEGLTSICVSFDSLDPVLFSASRAGATLEVVKRNVIDLARFRASSNSPPFELRLKPVLLAEEPYAEADRILRFSAEHGLEKPRFSTLDRRRAATDRYNGNLQVRDWVTQTADTVASWIDQRWTELTGEPLNEEPATAEQVLLPWINPRLREDLDVCDWAVAAAYIGGDGYCIPCCQQMGDLPRPQIASIFKKPLSRLWNDELLYAYRLPLSLGIVPARCEGCNYAPAREPNTEG